MMPRAGAGDSSDVSPSCGRHNKLFTAITAVERRALFIDQAVALRRLDGGGDVLTLRPSLRLRVLRTASFGVFVGAVILVGLTDLTLSCERLQARSGRAARQLPQRRRRGETANCN
jgi:hypothetical protein